jgi:hypothetical protein
LEELNPTNDIFVQDFKKRAAEGTGDSYMLTIARDGESPVRSVYFYSNAVDAATGYAAYTDWGFAKDFLTVELYEPTGRVHTKVLRRPRGGECAFHRSQYVELTEALIKVKDEIPENPWNYLTHEIGRLFSRDNQRFDHERFLAALGFTGEIDDRPNSN